MATNHSRRLDRLEEIHTPSGRPARRHRVIGDTEAELDERTQELIASGKANRAMLYPTISLSGRLERGILAGPQRPAIRRQRR